jgi:hypothetical protein
MRLVEHSRPTHDAPSEGSETSWHVGPEHVGAERAVTVEPNGVWMTAISCLSVGWSAAAFCSDPLALTGSAVDGENRLFR